MWTRCPCSRWPPVLLIGDRGTGKTHLLTGLCGAVVRRVRFTTAAALVNDLMIWWKRNVIAIDEVGHVLLAEVRCGGVFDDFLAAVPTRIRIKVERRILGSFNSVTFTAETIRPEPAHGCKGGGRSSRRGRRARTASREDRPAVLPDRRGRGRRITGIRPLLIHLLIRLAGTSRKQAFRNVTRHHRRGSKPCIINYKATRMTTRRHIVIRIAKPS